MRTALSIATAVLVAIILFALRHELVEAWRLLQSVDIVILSLLIPVQIIAYYAIGAMIFSYLKQKGDLDNTSRWEMCKMALELNFVNHLLPSGGVSGASYMTWRLRQLGVGPARATLAQVVRFVATFGAYLVLLLIAVLLITFDGAINRLTILVSTLLFSTIVFGTFFIIYVINSKARLHAFTRFLDNLINGFGRKVLRRKTRTVSPLAINNFFEELHEDYLSLKDDPRMLVRPFGWGLIATIAEISLFIIAFAALGSLVNPAPVLIAFGIATAVGVFFVTPGGIGGFELLMILFLTSSDSLPEGLAVAGVLLARVVLILGTIITGYVFYQLALNKYGKRTA